MTGLPSAAYSLRNPQNISHPVIGYHPNSLESILGTKGPLGLNLWSVSHPPSMHPAATESPR